MIKEERQKRQNEKSFSGGGKMSKDTTKQHITDCFNGLSRKYTLDQITVNMIAEAAGVSKSTFYRHFLDKYDVMNYNYKRVLDEIFRSTPARAGTSCFKHTFVYREGHKQDKARLFISRDELLRAVRFRVFVQTYEREVRRKRGSELREDEIFTAKLIIYGCVYAVKDWLFGDKRVSRQELARQIDNAIPEEYKALL